MQESIKLAFQEGSSDKVYHAELKQDGGGFVVNFEYGRRGSHLTTGTKTKTPVPYDVAKKTYDKLVKSKTAKGYQPQGGSASINTVATREDTEMRPQLLQEMEEKDVTYYIEHAEYCAQEKHDGKRRLLKEDGGKAIGANKKGQSVTLTPEIEKACLALMGSGQIIDGEDMGDCIMLFDDLTMPHFSYKDRYNLLRLSVVGNKHLVITETAWTTEEKYAMYEKLKAKRAEGMVFKKIGAAHTVGRTPDQLKCKFYATASCIVDSVSDVKSSISVSVLDDFGNSIGVGNVTVYPNQDTPKEGDIVEVKYLYYYPKGSLYQPVLLGVRDDVDHAECVISQLKLKQDVTAEV